MEMDPRRWTLGDGPLEPGCWSREIAQGWRGRWTGDGPSEMDPQRWTLRARMLVSGSSPGMERQMDQRWTLGDGPSEPRCWSQEVAQGWRGRWTGDGPLEMDPQSPDAGLRKLPRDGAAVRGPSAGPGEGPCVWPGASAAHSPSTWSSRHVPQSCSRGVKPGWIHLIT